MAAKKKETVQAIQVRRETITFVLKGTTPIILNCLARKAQGELLLPSQKKTSGDKRTTLKHDPIEEFRSSPHKSGDPKSKTLLQMPSTAFKSALRSVAIDIPCGSSKAQLGRLTYVEGEYVGIYGRPELKMDAVRCKDMNRTPDIRTRAVVPDWVALVSITYATPIINKEMIVNLMAHAGWLQGVGDFRPEKGAGNFGSWEIVELSDPDVKRIMKIGRKEQSAAMWDPEFYDEHTKELFGWFETEVKRRGLRKVD